MATSLENQYISSSYDKVVQISGSFLADGTGTTITYLDINVVSASYAVSASHEIIKEVSSSYADFAQTAGQSDLATTAFTASYIAGANVVGTVSSATSASHAVTASYALSGPAPVSASYALSSSHAGYAETAGVANEVAYNNITGKPTLVSGSSQIILQSTTGDLSGSRIDGAVASATSASHAVISDSSLSAISSSFASTSISSSHALSADTSISSSHALSANTAISASHALTADAVTGTVTNATYAQNTIITGKNVTGTLITKGTPLYFTGSGTSGNLVGVLPADASDPSLMPAGGIAGEAIASGAEGVVLLDGFINGVDTSAFSAGDEVFVAVGGGYTNVAPTGSANLVQKLGNVEKVDPTAGSGVINGPGAVRSVPNIAQDHVWKGDANGVAQPVNQSTLSVASAVSSSHAIISDTVKVGTTSSDTVYTFPLVSPGGNTLLYDSYTTRIGYNPFTNVLNNVNAYGTLVGNVTGDVKALNGTTVLDSGTDGTDATFTGTASLATSVSDPNIAYINQNNSFTGTQTFDNIAVNGTGSFAYIQAVTGSAKIIGDAFIILNNNTPSERYAGIKVIDSGSTSTTASFQFDGQTNDWFYEYQNGDPTNYGVALFGPEYATKGAHSYPLSNVIQKGTGGHHLTGSNISDNGTTIVLGSNSEITGSLGVSGETNLNGNANFKGTNTFTGASSIDGTSMTLESDASLILKEGPGGAGASSIIFYSGSNPGASYLSLQPQPSGNGSVVMTDSTDNSKFVIFNPTSGRTTFPKPIDGGTGGNDLLHIAAGALITGSLTVTGTINGNLAGNADTATSASHALYANAAGTAGAASTATTASYALTANSLTAGNKTLTGALTQNFDAPALNNEVALVNLGSASISGKSYDRVFFGVGDYSGFGANFEDYFAIEYYDGFGYNFGSEFNVNGKQTQLLTAASGSGQTSAVRTTDNYDGTSTLTLLSPNKIQLSGPTFLAGDSQLTGSLSQLGNTVQTGFTTQNFAAPGANEEKAFVNVSGAQIGSKNYNRVFYGIADYPAYGQSFEDYFAIEYYDSFGYNFGSELGVNGASARFITVPSGSGFNQRATIETKDNYNGTSAADVYGNQVNLGNVSQTNVVNLGNVNANINQIGNTYMSASSGFPLNVDGSMFTRRIHFNKNPFNDTPSDNLGAIRLDDTNKTFYGTLYNDNYEISSQSAWVLENNTTSSFNRAEIHANWGGSTSYFEVRNDAGVRSATLDTDTFEVTGSASFGSTITGSISTVYNNNTNSGSLGFWQGTQAEYNLISASASPNIIYFVV